MNEFEDTRTDREWGYFRQFIQTAGPCTVRFVFVKRGGVVSSQCDYKNQRLYCILDPMFTIQTVERESNPIAGDVFIAKPASLYRIGYNGHRDYGRFLDIVLGDNDEQYLWFDEGSSSNFHGKGSGCDF